jgi:hypothetical protein
VRIGIFKGEFQYDVVNVFADHLAEACRRHGVEPAIVDLRLARGEYAPVVERLENAPDTLGFVAFNGVGLAQRAALGLPPRRDKPAVAWLVDHPLEHLARVVELRAETIAAIDAGHAQFLKGLGLKNVICLPHAGASPQGEPDDRPWEERPIRVLMPGTIADPQALRTTMHAEIEAKLGREWASLYDDLVENPKIAFDDVLIARAQRARARAGDANALSPALCIVMTHAIRAKRNARRLAAVRALDAGGVGVDLCGKGWDAVEAFRSHRILATRAFPDVLRLFAEARFVLHVNPLFSAALHERVVYAALAGAVVLADANAMLKRVLAGGCGLLFDPAEAPDLAGRLAELEANGTGALMAAAGRERLRAEHTWDARAKSLIDALQGQSRLAKSA